MKVVLALVASCCLFFSTNSNPVTITVPETKALGPTDYRLEKFIIPENYKIELSLAKDFHSPVAPATDSKFNIDKCVITFKLDPTTPPSDKKVIRIHYDVDFVNDKVKLFDKDDAELVIVSFIAPNPETQIAVITLKEDLAQEATDSYKLEFTGLTGTLRNDMAGFYLSKYKVGTVDKFIATTQFQSTSARSAFPCFDEPFFKATFDITLTVPKEYTTVLANTAGKAVAPRDPDFTTIEFRTTPRMSTYLVAFIVSTFDKIDTSKYAIFFPEGMEESAKYAAKITPAIIKDLNDNLKLTYEALGNDQLYQAAIPDFSAGAMENWGLATYRETALLWDPAQSTARNKQRVCSVIAHEISHMWFGNSVTMEWWSDSFLNEGFARYFEYHTTANVESFDMKNQFVVEQQQVVFNADAVSTSLPLSSDPADIFTPNQVQSKFGSITYNKGGSVFRMIERAMGADKFYLALTTYLSAHKDKNTNLADLLAAFEAQGLRSGLTDWFTEGGYPVVTVTRQGNDVLLSQQRFLLDGKASDKKWQIPITLATNAQNKDFSNTSPAVWMQKIDATTKIIDAFKDTEIVVLNVQGSGYYRVNYESTILERINTQLRTATKGGIPALDRAVLIDDVMNMARVGLQSYDMALDLTKYLVDEDEYYPWVAAFNSFAFLNKRIGDQVVATWFKEYTVRMSKKLIDSVSFVVPTEHIPILKTALALQWACELEVTSCITESQKLFAAYIAAPTANPINPNLRSVVYCNGIRHGTKTEWDFLFGQYVAESSAAEKVTIMSALGCSKDTTILNEFLAKSLLNVEIRKQDAYSVFTSVVNGNAANLATAFDFLVKNFKEIPGSYASMNALSNIFNTLADRFTTTAQVAQFKKFLDENAAELGEAAKVGESALATAEANMAWTSKFQESIRSWLSRERGDDGAAPTITASVLFITVAAVMTFFY